MPTEGFLNHLRRCLWFVLVLPMCLSPTIAAAAQSAGMPPRDLIERVLKDLEADKAVKEWKGTPISMAEVAASVVVRRVDLNNDGEPDWLVVTTHWLWCGASGNCDLMIYATTNGAYRRVFPANLQQSFAIPTIGGNQLAGVRLGPRRNAGFLDVGWHSDSGSMVTPGPIDVVLKYDGNDYRTAR